jgi:hypothetical protein
MGWLRPGPSGAEVRRQIQLADDVKVFDLREMHSLLARSNGHHGAPMVRAAQPEAVVDSLRRHLARRAPAALE